VAGGPQEAQRPANAPRSSAGRLLTLFPWLSILVVAAVSSYFLEAPERYFALGIAAGALAGAAFAWSHLRRTVRSLRRWMDKRESDLNTWADDRAAAVCRQFAWAVDELVAMRAELRRVDALRIEAEELAAKADGKTRRNTEELLVARQKIFELGAAESQVFGEKARESEAALQSAQNALREEERRRKDTERRMRVAEHRVSELTQALRVVASTVASGTSTEALASRQAGSTPVSFDWTLEYDGTAHSLRLRCTDADIQATKVRILDASGQPVAEASGPARRARTASGRARSTSLVLRVPRSVAAAAESGDWSAFRLEAQVDDVWRGAVLVDRTAPVLEAQRADAAKRPAPMRIVS
jgi:hypothetical protein